jgi:hypothetical protein
VGVGELMGLFALVPKGVAQQGTISPIREQSGAEFGLFAVPEAGYLRRVLQTQQRDTPKVQQQCGKLSLFRSLIAGAPREYQGDAAARDALGS